MARLAAMMADTALYTGDPQKLIDLQKRLSQLEKDLAAAEDVWLRLHEQWDQARAEFF